MTKKYLYLPIIIIICIVIVIFNFQGIHSNEKLIEAFLKKALSRSEENITLYKKIYESPGTIGLGVDKETEEQSWKDNERVSEAIKRTYGEYLNDSGLEDFENGILALLFQIYDQDKTYEILKIKVKEDKEFYKFQSVLKVNGQKKVLEGRVEISDDKITKIRVVQ